MIKVREAHRPLDHLLAMGLTPVDDGFEEGIDDFIIIDEVDEAEADIILIPRFVGSMVDDPSDTPDDAPLLVG